MSGQLVDGGAMSPCSPAGARPAVHRPDPRRARDDHNPIPYQVALAAQDLLDAILGDEPFDLAEVAPQLARLAAFTDVGHAGDRLVWSRARVLARVVELVETYNPPPELGGDVDLGVGEFVGAR